MGERVFGLCRASGVLGGRVGEFTGCIGFWAFGLGEGGVRDLGLPLVPALGGLGV